MRLTGGCALDDSEWVALEDTEISSADSPKLKGTEMWYESAYEWSIVAMSQALRSQMSAKENEKPLFVIQAGPIPECIRSALRLDQPRRRQRQTSNK